MAPTFLFVLYLAHLISSNAQTVIGTSSSFSSSLDQPGTSTPNPTKETVPFKPSFPSRGRSDVPIRATLRDGLSNSVQPGSKLARPTTPSKPSVKPTLSTVTRSSGSTVNQADFIRSRTDTASLDSNRAKAKLDSTTKGTTIAQPILHLGASITVATEKDLDTDLQGLGSGNVPTTKDEILPPPGTYRSGWAQYRPPAQTVPFEGTSLPTVVDTSTLGQLTEKPDVLDPTTKSRTTANTEEWVTESPVVMQSTPQPAVLAGELTANAPSSDRSPTIKHKTPQTTTTTTRQENSEVYIISLNTTTTTTSATPTTSTTTSTRKAVQILPKIFISNKTVPARPSMDPTSPKLTRMGTSSFLTTGIVPVTRPRSSPTYQSAVSFGNRSFPLGRPHHPPTVNPVPSPTVVPDNGTFLYWGDLSRTLAFVWELHVYGTASLFLLLFAGAALGLTLSPGANCPHRGALALANILLFVAGGIRATFFLTDPYSTRKFFPRPAVIALYNLPLHLLVWTQATMSILAMRAAGVSSFPLTLERPPLVAVLAVLQCTLLLAADLLSSALSPVVPVTLQFLSLSWGLVVCFVFLCYIFPQIRCPHLPHAALPDESRRKAWTGSRRLVVILGRVLAVCAVLGALCCCLHAHATLWLHGLLGDWTRFNWGWWLVQFWARLLELAWGFSLLLLASWLFWKPQIYQGGDQAGTDGRAVGDMSSAGQSTVSSQRHTCWSKIVQSLKGKPCRKSESNGMGSAQGEVPNNWAGQDRSAANISKSIIRNQNQTTTTAGPINDNNRRANSAERGVSDDSSGSLLRLQPFTHAPQRSVSGSQDLDRDTSVSLYEFDLRPPSPIDLTRSIDEALHREHLVTGGSLFHPALSQTPSPCSGLSQGPWLRRNSDPQLSESSDATESSMPLGGSVISSVPSRQVTAPPTPSHQGHKWAGAMGSVPSSVSCPVSLRPSRTSSGRLEEDAVDDTRPFITPDSEKGRHRAARPAGSRSYLEVSRHDDSASVSSEIINL
ncbi:uncharacterized protein [Eucyclogobius newberryi]|uniref:uncharacterized protein n=1 Tax=Eucyclogobius newberryi TaxID=166745 RepID=UPI003B5CEECC